MDISRCTNYVISDNINNNTDNYDCIEQITPISSDSNARGVDDSKNITDYGKNLLLVIAEIGARENAMCPRALGVLALVCRDIYNSVQWRLNIMSGLRKKYMRGFGTKLHERLIGHPINYTGKHVKVTSIGDMGYDHMGMRILDISAGLSSDDFARTHRLAFTNICFLTHDPKPFVCVLMLKDQAVIAVEFSADDYIDTGELTPAEREYVDMRYGDNPILRPGRYLIDLNLKTRINPIIIGEHFINVVDVRLALAENYSTFIDAQGEYVTDIQPDMQFIAETFTHAMIHFKTVPADSYNWRDYVLTFNREINKHAVTTSFIRKRSDIRVDTTPHPPTQLAPEYLALLQQIVTAFSQKN